MIENSVKRRNAELIGSLKRTSFRSCSVCNVNLMGRMLQQYIAMMRRYNGQRYSYSDGRKWVSPLKVSGTPKLLAYNKFFSEWMALLGNNGEYLRMDLHSKALQDFQGVRLIATFWP
ncbi:hypothetical protein J6590_034901 [Homalodisca vitripennis]|nr:hypothetical protein J6590_034901 [Homalodisca vitripennis]